MLIKRALVRVVLSLILAVLLGHTLHQVTENAIRTGTAEKPFLLIDPGHGGRDGGAVAPNGALEDDINLSISLDLRDMLSFCGYTVKMTRAEDTAILHEDDHPENSWKVNDMHNRLELVNRSMLAISVHQNHFSQSKYHGAQIFYSPNRPESRDIAMCIREQIIGMLQTDNKREIKAAGENIFLLHNATAPALIVECGFLSNEEEARQLQNTAYQQQMAFAICCGVLQYAP